jgi:hypothetical protein
MNNLSDFLLREIPENIPATARVLLLQRSDTALSDHLHKRGNNLQILCPDMLAVESTIRKGIPTIHGDFARELPNFGTATFAHAVLSADLNNVDEPAQQLRELLRIGQSVFAYFANTANVRNRLRFLLRGDLAHDHAAQFLTIKNFNQFCRNEEIVIQRQKCLASLPFLPDWNAAVSLFQLSKLS